MKTKIKNGIPLAPIAKIISEASGLRVSNSSANELREVLFEVALLLIENAKEVAVHSNRKTIQSKDISYAYNQLKKNLKVI